MQNIEDFESWVKTKGGQRGLAHAFSRKFPKEKPISQTAVSNWVTRRVIPVDRRPQLKAMGWDGPWEWADEPILSTITREEFAEFRGATKAELSLLRDGLEKALELIRDLAGRLPEGSRPKGF
ncbi:MAG: hypothetical protein ABIW76_13170 [Fibrobacteria bacterium]